jgi:hypothetical protein
VHYDRLTPQAAAELERVGREAAQRVLLDINRQAMALGAEEVPEGSVARRVNFGIYILSEDERGA